MNARSPLTSPGGDPFRQTAPVVMALTLIGVSAFMVYLFLI